MCVCRGEHEAADVCHVVPTFLMRMHQLLVMMMSLLGLKNYGFETRCGGRKHLTNSMSTFLLRGQLWRQVLPTSVHLTAPVEVLLYLDLSIERVLEYFIEVSECALGPNYLIFSMKSLKLVKPTNHGVIGLLKSAVIRQKLQGHRIVLVGKVMQPEALLLLYEHVEGLKLLLHMCNGVIQELIYSHNLMLTAAHRIVRTRYHRLHRQIIVDVFMMALVTERHRVCTTIECDLFIML